ncbi:SDH family Clp fold serine proteinase [Ensifer adhaerens]|uniref:Serine dehydrogenase proteinase n=1 Tax=Ensifer adhaerens TaxID=106592 RepID=A0ABY8HC36_ENSAD|nr:hypothetical protein [Ensifer adhaerens]KDP73612.1 hypothetical protein FA04_10930 [Ensifer adhaerens]WFP89661.1 hypothetical protein P4B07_13960 [Ensifer adhaerens]
MIDTVEDGFEQAIRDVADAYDADIYVYSGNIDHAGFGKVVEAFSRDGRPNALVILTTNGGLANSAYKISRFFQSQYDRFIIFIPSVCKSAGTLLAIGAHELIMSTFSELGPLDVQLYERDEIGARKSGLLSHSAFDALKAETFALYEHFMLSIKQRSADNISFPIASEVAGDMASRVMSPIFEQISPSILGSDYRDLQVAIEYGNRLALQSENITFEAVKFLTEQYPSHDFIIDKNEAEKLFHDVEAPKPELWALIKYLKDFVFVPHEPTTVFNLNSFLEVVDDEQSEREASEPDTEEAEPTGLDSGQDGDRDGTN